MDRTTIKYIKIENKKVTNMTNNTFIYDYNENSLNQYLTFLNLETHILLLNYFEKEMLQHIYEVHIQITNLNF